MTASVQLDIKPERCYNAAQEDSPMSPPDADTLLIDMAAFELEQPRGRSSERRPLNSTEAAIETCPCVVAQPRPQTLEVDLHEGRPTSVRWYVDAAKLRQKQVAAIVSPPFELLAGGHCIEFKVVVRAWRNGAEPRKHTNFKDSEGRGTVELKCESDLDRINGRCSEFLFRASIGNGEKEWKNSRKHDFASSAVGYISEDQQDQWDFRKSIHKESGTFVVCLEIVPANSIRLVDTQLAWCQ